MKLLLCEDDSSVGQLVQRGLSREGFRVDWVQRGQRSLDLLESGGYDALILDLILPDLDGFAVCRRVRTLHQALPVLMLTARDAVADKVGGLSAGADDYLTKPFAFEELVARIRALQRRHQAQDRALAHHPADLELDPDTRQAWHLGTRITLTEREFQLLDCLLARAGKPVSRERIIRRVWGLDTDISDNTVDVYVGYLRRKLADAGSPRLIETVRGMGFMLRRPLGD